MTKKLTKRRGPTRRYVDSVMESVQPTNGNGRRGTDQHKWFKIGTVGSFCVIVSVIGPYFSSFLGGYERADHARSEMAKVYRLIGSMSRSLAWNSVSAIKTEMTVAENRATDCDVKVAQGQPMTIMEMQACSKWRADAEDAKRRYASAYDAATAAAKAQSSVAAQTQEKGAEQ